MNNKKVVRQEGRTVGDALCELWDTIITLVLILACFAYCTREHWMK